MSNNDSIGTYQVLYHVQPGDIDLHQVRANHHIVEDGALHIHGSGSEAAVFAPGQWIYAHVTNEQEN